MSLLLTFILLFLAALHLYSNWRIQPHSLYLSGALLSISYNLVIHYLVIFGTSTFWLALLFGHVTPLIYLMGPMMFFYVRGVLTDNPRLSKRDFIHFIPALLDLVTRIPYFLKPWSHKLWLAGELISDISNLHRIANEFFPPSNIALPLRIIMMIGYTVYCLWMVWQFRRTYSVRNRVPIQVASVPIRFLFFLLMVSLVVEISLTTLMLKFFTGRSISQEEVVQHPLLYISFLGILSIPIIMQLHPGVLYGIPRWRSREENGE